MATLEKPIQIESTVDINGVSFCAYADEYIYASGADCAVAPHKHSYFELCYVEKGKAVVVKDDREYEITEGNVYLYHPNEYHCRPLEKLGEDFAQYSLRFRIQPTSKTQKSDAAAKQMLEALFATEGFNTGISGIATYAKRLATEMHEKLLGYKSSAESLLGLIITEVARLAYGNGVLRDGLTILNDAGRAAKIERFFGIYYAEKIRLSDLAAYINLSPRQADRILRREFGMTFLEKLNEVRLSATKHRLAFGNESVKDIAFACGFQSYGYFASSFKKYVGITPMEYRRKKQGI